MTTVTLHGNPVELDGTLVKVGDKLSGDLLLTSADLADLPLKDLVGDAKALVLNLFPSIDTGICATSVREFNARCNDLKDAKVLCVSGDLPFAQARFCGAEGLDRVLNFSTFRNQDTAKALGLLFKTGGLKGLVHRAVVVCDKDLNVTFVNVVPEVGSAVDFDAAIEAVNKLVA